MAKHPVSMVLAVAVSITLTGRLKVKLARSHSWVLLIDLHPGKGLLRAFGERGVSSLNPSPSACRVEEHALAQEIELGAAIHLALEQLEAIDLPFNGSLAPGVAQGGAHGRLVSA